MLPSVSCILPCGYGDKYVGTAIQCFFDQTYEGELELVIVDNNDGDIKFGVNAPSNLDQSRVFVKYIRSARKSVGALRNLGTQHATGEICITWDEDDWSHPDRIAQQVKRLQESGKAVTGWHNILYYDTRDGRTYKYFFESSGRNHPPYAMGTSQCYLKSWWKKHPFPETGVEDYAFQLAALHAGQLDSCDAEQLCVARAHDGSACPPQLRSKQFPQVSRELFPQEFFDAVERKEATQIPLNSGNEVTAHV
jgi:glycosyltransferase involved in cell wall biosynthesis